MAELQTNVKQGAIIGGWICFAVGLAFMALLPLLGFIFYGPLFFAAFVLSIVAMAQRRVAGGLTLLLCCIVLPPIFFFARVSQRAEQFSQSEPQTQKTEVQPQSQPTETQEPSVKESGTPQDSSEGISDWGKRVLEQSKRESQGSSEDTSGRERKDETQAQEESYEPAQVPRGKWQETDDGGVLTLSDGQKFVCRTLLDKSGAGEVRLTFPNGQAFSLETAKGASNPPFVSEDGTLVAVEHHPATQTGELHIYVKEGNSKFKEVPSVNEQVDKLLKGVKGACGGEVLYLRALSDHTLTLWSVDLQQGHIVRKYQFTLKVAPDGSLALGPITTARASAASSVPNVTGSDASDQRLTKFTNRKYGCAILVPLDVFPDPPQQPDDEHTKFVSTDGRTTLELVVDQNPQKRAVAEVYRKWIAQGEKKGAIGYKTLKGNWFVVSGDVAGRGYYTKCVGRDNKLFLMNVDYDEDGDAIQENTMTAMSRSFNGRP